MNCPGWASGKTRASHQTTALGYRTFRCSAWARQFNERTGTPFNYLEFPTDIVLLVVLGRLRYKLSLRDLAEMFLVRGSEFTHEAVRDWAARCAPLITAGLRAKRRGTAGRSWYVDETYVKVSGQWHYLYRAIDRDGNLVDSMLRQKRDMDAARTSFPQARDVHWSPYHLPPGPQPPRVRRATTGAFLTAARVGMWNAVPHAAPGG